MLQKRQCASPFRSNCARDSGLQQKRHRRGCCEEVLQGDNDGNLMGFATIRLSPLMLQIAHMNLVNLRLTKIRQLPRMLARNAIRGYRYLLSPLLGWHCRHLPTCSDYADQAIGRFGLWVGGWMTLARILRCHPFGTSGLDFVPPSLRANARWWAPWRYGQWRGTRAALPAANVEAHEG